MVCARCKLVVKNTLTEIGYPPLQVELGEVTFENELSKASISLISDKLNVLGFEILDDKKSQTVSLIKSVIIQLVREENAFLKTNLSDYLTQKIGLDYTHLSHLFSQLESKTIEQYFIHLKTERVKELLVYDELSVKEIAYLLNYSSVGHLSRQFKKTTGLTPTHFKSTGTHKRKLIDQI